MFKYSDINTGVWRFVMEQEVGYGWTDIIVVGPTKAIIYEVKKVSNIKAMEQSATQALMQVETQKYYMGLVQTTECVWEYDIAFYNKQCHVVSHLHQRVGTDSWIIAAAIWNSSNSS